MDQHKDATRRPDGRQDDKKRVETKSNNRQTTTDKNEQSYVQLVGEGRQNQHNEDRDRRTKENVNRIGKKGRKKK